MKIERATLRCEVEVPTAVTPPPAVDSVEGKVDGPKELVALQLFAVLKQVPTPGVAELEVSAKVAHALGGKLSVTAEREAGGDYLVRVAGKAVGILPAVPHVSGEVRAEGGATFRLRSPGAAAEFLAALASSARASPLRSLSSGDVQHVAHVSRAHLARVELSAEVAAHASGRVTLVEAGSVDLSGRLTAQLDLERGALITRQAVTGEAFGRASILLARAGVRGELSFALRTEGRIPPELLSGAASLEQVLAGFEGDRKLLVTFTERAEAGTLFAPGAAQVTRVEAELDLETLFAHPDEPRRALKGEATHWTTRDRALSVGVDVPGFSFLGRAAIFDVTSSPWLGRDEAQALQAELDVCRALSP